MGVLAGLVFDPYVPTVVPFFFGVGRFLLLRGERDPLPVRRPLEGGNRRLVLEALLRLAALRLHQVDGPLALLAVRLGTDGEKGEKASVRPPAGAGVVFGIPGELDVLGPGPLRQREEPDVGV